MNSCDIKNQNPGKMNISVEIDFSFCYLTSLVLVICTFHHWSFCSDEKYFIKQFCIDLLLSWCHACIHPSCDAHMTWCTEMHSDLEILILLWTIRVYVTMTILSRIIDRWVLQHVHICTSGHWICIKHNKVWEEWDKYNIWKLPIYYFRFVPLCPSWTPITPWPPATNSREMNRILPSRWVWHQPPHPPPGYRSRRAGSQVRRLSLASSQIGTGKLIHLLVQKNIWYVHLFLLLLKLNLSWTKLNPNW